MIDLETKGAVAFLLTIPTFVMYVLFCAHYPERPIYEIDPFLLTLVKIWGSAIFIPFSFWIWLQILRLF